MSSLPESDPLDPESNETRRKDSRTHEEVLSAVNKYFPNTSTRKKHQRLRNHPFFNPGRNLSSCRQSRAFPILAILRFWS